MKKQAFAFILVTAFLDSLSLGIVLPVLPKLVESFVSGNTAHAALYTAAFVMIWEIMQLVFSPVMGALSDRFGRKPVVLLSNLGLGLDYVLMAVAPNVGILFVGRAISGVTTSSLVTAYAYVSDVVPVEKRAQAFGALAGVSTLAFVAGPALGGYLGEISLRLPFWVAATFSLVNTAYGVLVLPESLVPEKRSPFLWAKANTLGALHIFLEYPKLLRFVTVDFLLNVGGFVFPVVLVLYAGVQFGWGPSEVGVALAALGILGAIGQSTLVGPLISRLGDHNAMRFCIVAGILGYATLGLAPTGKIFILGAVLIAILSISNPLLQRLQSERVSESEQGRLQGALASVVAIAGIVSPPIFAAIFRATLGKNPGIRFGGAPFYAAAGALILSFIVISGVEKTD